MLPIVALVGRPNVGKSTLFNTLTGTRDALVADVPGVTRDRQYGYARGGDMPCVVVDTGGLIAKPSSTVEQQMRVQTERAIEEADRLVLVVDGRAGLTTEDIAVAKLLHRSGKPVVLAINKAEGLDAGVVAAEFHRLGLGTTYAISAANSQGCQALLDAALAGLEATEVAAEENDDSIRIAVIGRPNVGKSTLVNRLIGEERVIATDIAGTTRDSIFVPFERDGRKFTLIDTAGVRRRARVTDAVERASVARSLQAIEAAHVVVLVLDAHEGIAEQDASVLGLALQRGRALLLAINKWDGIPMDQREAVRSGIALRLDFVPFAPQLFISARHGTGVGELAAAAVKAYDAAMRDMRTPQLTRVLEKALEAHQPPLVKGRRIKLRYAHQGGRNPPRIVIHGNQTEATPDAYRRYLSNTFRQAFDLYACPVVLELRGDANPFQRREKREAVARKDDAKKKGGQKNAARRAPRKKVASGKANPKRPRR
ncbi:MAG: ribosome biogenesis GTPase Der [Proteobacteria bacterium]|nr:ribosome biogenesis GTPase Der [Pseudomonadota bacterium]